MNPLIKVHQSTDCYKYRSNIKVINWICRISSGNIYDASQNTTHCQRCNTCVIKIKRNSIFTPCRNLFNESPSKSGCDFRSFMISSGNDLQLLHRIHIFLTYAWHQTPLPEHCLPYRLPTHTHFQVNIWCPIKGNAIMNVVELRIKSQPILVTFRAR